MDIECKDNNRLNEARTCEATGSTFSSSLAEIEDCDDDELASLASSDSERTAAWSGSSSLLEDNSELWSTTILRNTLRVRVHQITGNTISILIIVADEDVLPLLDLKWKIQDDLGRKKSRKKTKKKLSQGTLNCKHAVAADDARIQTNTKLENRHP